MTKEFPDYIFFTHGCICTIEKVKPGHWAWATYTRYGQGGASFSGERSETLAVKRATEEAKSYHKLQHRRECRKEVIRDLLSCL